MSFFVLTFAMTHDFAWRAFNRIADHFMIGYQDGLAEGLKAAARLIRFSLVPSIFR